MRNPLDRRDDGTSTWSEGGWLALVFLIIAIVIGLLLVTKRHHANLTVPHSKAVPGTAWILSQKGAKWSMVRSGNRGPSSSAHSPPRSICLPARTASDRRIVRAYSNASLHSELSSVCVPARLKRRWHPDIHSVRDGVQREAADRFRDALRQQVILRWRDFDDGVRLEACDLYSTTQERHSREPAGHCNASSVRLAWPSQGWPRADAMRRG